MEVNNTILKRKFIGDIPETEMQLIEKACEIDKRNRISLIRKGACDLANKIIQEKQNARTETD